MNNSEVRITFDATALVNALDKDIARNGIIPDGKGTPETLKEIKRRFV